MTKKLYTTALILAAGVGSRMQSDTTKQRMLVHGKPLLRYTLEAFEKSALTDAIVIAAREEEYEAVSHMTEGLQTPCTVVFGGENRAESARRAFDAVPDMTTFVAIHDGARALIHPEDIDRVIRAAHEYTAASAVSPVCDTVKHVTGGYIDATVSRDALAFASTPQVFSCDLYRRAICECTETVTDDNMLLEGIGIYPRAVELLHPNVKITTASDLRYAEFLLKEKTMQYRVGHGYDVHRFAKGRPLVLGGVTIPADRGLDGHSDADVLVHAIMDALLGGAGLGDIGRHFPDSDEAYRGISSLVLLSRVRELLSEVGAQIVNVDATVVLQRPKIAPYINIMEENVREALRLPEGCVNIKATTEEHLGFTGREEGAAAHAVAMLRK